MVVFFKKASFFRNLFGLYFSLLFILLREATFIQTYAALEDNHSKSNEIGEESLGELDSGLSSLNPDLLAKVLSFVLVQSVVDPIESGFNPPSLTRKRYEVYQATTLRFQLKKLCFSKNLFKKEHFKLAFFMMNGAGVWFDFSDYFLSAEEIELYFQPPEGLCLGIQKAVFKRGGFHPHPRFFPLSLVELDLSHKGLTELDLSFLSGMHHLEICNLKHNQIQCLVPALQKLSTLTVLNLSHNSIISDGLTSLGLLGQSLKSLDLSSNFLGDRGFNTLAYGIGSQLECLFLGNNRVRLEGVLEIMGLFFREWNQIVHLDLSDHRLGVAGAVTVSTGLFGIQGLNLSNNQIQSRGLLTLTPSLQQVRWLNLSNNHLETFAIAILARHIKQVEYLDLSVNRMDIEVAESIEWGFSSLKWLNLSFNRVGPQGARGLAGKIKGIHFCNLTYTGLGDQGIEILAETLRGVLYLNLRANQIGYRGVKALAPYLHGIEYLNLSANPIGDSGALALAQSIHGVKKLFLASSNLGIIGVMGLVPALNQVEEWDLEDNQVREDQWETLLSKFQRLSLSNEEGNRVPVLRLGTREGWDQQPLRQQVGLLTWVECHCSLQ